MSGNVLIFSHKFDIVQRVMQRGYTPIYVGDENVFSLPNFIHVSAEDARRGLFDLEMFRHLQQSPMRGVLGCFEYYVELAQLVRREFFPHLVGVDPKVATAIRDKVIFKNTLAEYGIPSAAHCLLMRDWGAIVAQIGNPFLIKPRNGVLARDIALITSEADWKEWWSRVSCPDDYYAEEYLTDIREYCCDTLMAGGRVLAQFPGEYTRTCLESSHTHDGIGVDFPGFCPPSAIEDLKSLARSFLLRRGIHDGFCHMEFFYSDGMWKFGEMGWRLPGGFQLPTESYLANTSLLDRYLDIFIDTEPTPQEPLPMGNSCYGYYLYPKKPGRIKRIMASFDFPWIAEHKLYVQEGQEVPFEDSSVAMSAHIVYRADTVEDLKKCSALAPSLMQIEYE